MSDNLRVKRSRLIRWKLGVVAALTVACASTLSAHLEEPAAGAAAPQDGQPTSRPWRRGGLFDAERGYGYGGQTRRGPGEWQEIQPPNADEWRDVVAFMKENSPARLKIYQKIEDERGMDSRLTIGVRKRAAARYRDLLALKDRNSDMYDFAFRQFKLEDAVIDTLAEIARTSETPELLAQRQKKIHEFVENSLNERDARLGKLKELVKREEAALAQDRKDMTTLEDKQRERFERELRRLVEFATDTDSPTTRPDAR